MHGECFNAVLRNADLSMWGGPAGGGDALGTAEPEADGWVTAGLGKKNSESLCRVRCGWGSGQPGAITDGGPKPGRAGPAVPSRQPPSPRPAVPPAALRARPPPAGTGSLSPAPPATPPRSTWPRGRGARALHLSVSASLPPVAAATVGDPRSPRRARATERLRGRTAPGSAARRPRRTAGTAATDGGGGGGLRGERSGEERPAPAPGVGRGGGTCCWWCWGRRGGRVTRQRWGERGACAGRAGVAPLRRGRRRLGPGRAATGRGGLWGRMGVASGFRNLLGAALIRGAGTSSCGGGAGRAAGLRRAEVARASRGSCQAGRAFPRLRWWRWDLGAALTASRHLLALPAELSAEPVPSSPGGSALSPCPGAWHADSPPAPCQQSCFQKLEKGCH